jgi:hypothetical protein
MYPSHGASFWQSLALAAHPPPPAPHAEHGSDAPIRQQTPASASKAASPWDASASCAESAGEVPLSVGDVANVEPPQAVAMNATRMRGAALNGIAPTGALQSLCQFGARL